VGVKGGRCVRIATSPPSVSRLSKQVWEPPRPVTGIALRFSCFLFLLFLLHFPLLPLLLLLYVLFKAMP
jgi:hypothetical protein